MKCPKCNYENEEGALCCNLCSFVFKKEENFVSSQSGTPDRDHYRFLDFFIRNKIAVLFITIIFVFVGFKAIRDAHPIKSIDISGDYATIRYGDMLMKAKMEPQVTEGFLVNNGFEGKRSDGWFWVIPMEQVRALKAAYGDFVHCNSPGASAAKGSMQMLVLFSADKQIREKIKKVIKRSLNSPIIEIRGSNLEIEEHLVGNKKYSQFDPNTPENYYLIEDILITQENYQ